MPVIKNRRKQLNRILMNRQLFRPPKVTAATAYTDEQMLKILLEDSEEIEDEKAQTPAEMEQIIAKFTSVSDLRWHNGAGGHLRIPNRHEDGSSPRNLRLIKLNPHQSARLTSYFQYESKPEAVLPPAPIIVKREGYKWRKEELGGETENQVKANIKIDARARLKMMSVRLLMKEVLNGNPRQSSAKQIAEKQFNLKGKAAHEGGKRIIEWAYQVLRTGVIDSSKKGCHKKTTSLIEDEDILRKCQQHLRTYYKSDDERTPARFHLCINRELLINQTDRRISSRTAYRWMEICGFEKVDVKKGVFHDRHEADDVKEERRIYLNKIQGFEKFMVQYVGDEYETELQPEARYNGKKIFCAVKTNPPAMLMMLLGLGKSIMISAIICPCHGIMEWNGEKSYETLEAGTNREGWWVADDVVKKVIKVIKIFEQLHPDSIGLFQFDSSSNHHAMVADSLVASKLNLSDGGAVPLMRDTVFNGHVQKMQTAEDVQKGISIILQERGKWTNGLRLDCKDNCSSHNGCCARRILASEEDFLNEKTIVQRAAEDKGHLFIKSPKYHCKLQYTESFWGNTKRYMRSNCDYSITGLRNLIHTAMRNDYSNNQRILHLMYAVYGCL
ncbi:hypothetical protein GcM3_149012 [Golovinomyces cichoracearum]|uniref:DDE-1 domain-containing protein n=1 Tax=Golovinomyces cichoracearum TaxID=62708 RepID=A0A420HXI4_9PEZI|nr:hypothetical protein GcM3_149012 [Golovinomyces cichoracearum]